MKIGILTNHRPPNYGAMLQAYALWKTLEGMGHDVVFLDSIWSAFSDVPLWKCLYARNLHSLRIKLRDYLRHPMTSFAKDFPSTPLLRNFQDHVGASRDLDALIVGSDQVWNPRWVLPWLDIQFLGFAPDNCKRISYAASLAVTEWGGEKRQEVAELLSRFDAISVRETSGVAVIRSLANVNVQMVLDPVLLHDADFYKSLASDIEGRAKPTLFTYFAGSTPLAAEQRCIDAGLSAMGSAVHVSDKSPICRGFIGKRCMKYGIHGAIPVSRWLGEIANASFVLSDSFHGTAISILFHRPFAVRLLLGVDAGMNERLLSLLETAGIKNRTFTDSSTDAIGEIMATPIDWDEVDHRIKCTRTDSLGFLQKALAIIP